jgi:oxygen-independent coproporphyrinogen III oxidase
MMTPGVYLHIPFCKSRCSYCDFATDVFKSGAVVERYVNALITEISEFGFPDKDIHNNPDTIYFGGGTPSLLEPDQLEGILIALQKRFRFSSDIEFTLEMNPATVDLDKLKAFKDLGVNRASFGAQTFDDEALRLLARGHDRNDIFKTYDLLIKAGFENISLDLIAGLPGQTMSDWNRNLDEAIAFESPHISLYLLEIHESTPLAEQLRSGRRPLPDEDLAAEMYTVMLERLSEAGFKHYEISNFAKPGFESRHNLKYWDCSPVHAYGVSAVGFDGQYRYTNNRDTKMYVDVIESGESPVSEREEVNLGSELAFLGLRLTDGLDLNAYQKRTGENLRREKEEEILDLVNKGLLIIESDRLKLTEKGLLFSNDVFEAFV